MIKNVLGPDGKVTADTACDMRDSARRNGESDPIFEDPVTGNSVWPRRGYSGPLGHRQAHAYFPPEETREDVLLERRKAVDSLEELLKTNSGLDASTFMRGQIVFHDQEQRIQYQNLNSFTYDLSVIVAKDYQGDQFAFLLVNRTPLISDYLRLLTDLGNRDNFPTGEKSPKITNHLITEDDSTVDLSKTLYLATIQLKNSHMYRPQPEYHGGSFLRLGDWQAMHLSKIYPEFVFFDAEKKTMQSVLLKLKPHQCEYADSRYRTEFRVPKSAFCQQAESPDGALSDFTFEPYKLKKNSTADAIGNHPRLYLAKIKPQNQLTLF